MDFLLKRAPDLSALANKMGSDKGTQIGDAHGYSLVYQMLLAQQGRSNTSLVEIGLQIGGPELGSREDRDLTATPSIDMWLQYFSKSKIYGIDICDFSQFEKDGFTFIRADCGNWERLEAVQAALPQVDVIIDDGSHASFHQQLTLCALYPKLRSGGLYFIEDVMWQPDHIEAASPSVTKTYELLFDPVVEVESDLSRKVLELTAGSEWMTCYWKSDLDALRDRYNTKHSLPMVALQARSWKQQLKDVVRPKRPVSDEPKMIVIKKS